MTPATVGWSALFGTIDLRFDIARRRPMVRHVGGSDPDTDALRVIVIVVVVFVIPVPIPVTEGNQRASWFATARKLPGPRTDTDPDRLSVCPCPCFRALPFSRTWASAAPVAVCERRSRRRLQAMLAA
jgi:hypothetical protein